MGVDRPAGATPALPNRTTCSTIRRPGASLVTTEDLVGDLRALGVSLGQTLMVHSSLRSLGHVLGCAPAVVRALLAALGPDSTLVMPGFSPEVSDPARWPDRPLPVSDIERARAHVPVFDPDTTPTSMGAIPECFRRWRGTRRGPHSRVSVCTLGPRADEIVAPHPLAWGQGGGLALRAPDRHGRRAAARRGVQPRDAAPLCGVAGP